MLLGLLLCTASRAIALDPATPLSQYSLDGWGLREGLRQLSVPALAQTPDGYLWVGTVDGLERFDGVRFTHYDAENTPALRGNIVNALLVDSSGILWIGTDKGLASYQSGQFTSHALTGANSSALVWSFCEIGKGRLWVGTSIGLFAREGSAWKHYTTREGLPNVQIHALAAGENGSLWAGTSGGLTHRENGSFKVFTRKDGLPSEIVLSVAWLPGDGLWVGTTGGLARLPAGGRLEPFDLSGPRLKSRSGALAEKTTKAVVYVDRRGALWIGTSETGLARYAGGTLSWLHFNPAAGSPRSVHGFCEDREGNLWVGTRDSGLLRLKQPSFSRYGQREGLLSDTVFAAVPDGRGRMWVATAEGVSRIESGPYEPSALWPHRGLRNVYGLLPEPDGTIWLAIRENGLRRIGTGGEIRAYTVRDGLGGNQVWSMARTADGSIWAGTTNGLTRIRPNAVRTFGVRDGLTNGYISAVNVDRGGTLWAGTWGGGLHRFDGERPVPLADKDGTRNMVRIIFEDRKGRIWVGTQGGLGLVNGNAVMAVASQDRWLGNALRSIGEDDLGNLWFNTTRGVVQANADALARAAHQGNTVTGVQVLGSGEELRSVLQTAPAPQPQGAPWWNGRLWMISHQGLIGIDPRSAIAPAAIVPAAIEGININGEPGDAPFAGVARAGPGNDRLEIQYTGLSLSAPNRTVFRYRLADFDRTWVEAADRRVATYTRVPPGEYRFEVMAAVTGGPWGPPAQIELKVQPYFWQTWWFLVLCGLLLGYVTWFVRRRQIRQIEMRHALVLGERTRIAREIHDTYLQGFTGIALQLEALARRLPGNSEEARLRLEEILLRADRCLREARQSVWNLRQFEELGRDLPDDVKSAVKPVLELASVPCSCITTGELRPLPPEVAAEIQRILVEAARNVVRHASATETHIYLAGEPEGCHLKLVDNGCGFDPAAGAAKAGHYGLRGMEERAQAIGARLEVTSRPGDGTTVALWLPWPRTSLLPRKR